MPGWATGPATRVNNSRNGSTPSLARALVIDPDQATSASSGPAPDQPNPSINCRNTSS